MKKILSLILTAAMLMSAVVMTAGAENIGEGVYAPNMPSFSQESLTQALDENQVDAQGIYYTLDDEAMTAIVGKNTYADSASAAADLKTDSIVIPETVTFGGNSYAVVAVGRNAFDGTNVREAVVLCSTIGEFAFAGCTKLEYVYTTATEVKGFAFWGCTALITALIAGADSIGGGAFWNCSNLQNPIIDANVIMEKAFVGCASVEYFVMLGDAPAVAAGAFDADAKAYISANAAGYEDFPIETVAVVNNFFYDIEDVYAKAGETVIVNINHAAIEAGSYEVALTLAEGLSTAETTLAITVDNSSVCGVLASIEVTVADNLAAGTYVIKGVMTGDTLVNPVELFWGSVTICDHANTKTVTVKSASCDEAGTENTVCTACGEVISTADVEAKGHSYKDFVIAPTCTEGGYTRHICECCADAYTDTETEATGHAWNEGQVIVEASTTKDGLVRYTCLTCGTTNDVIVPKVKYGDANNDGSINLSDVAAMLQFIAKWDMSASTFNEVNADANGDASVNLSDVSKTLQFIAKWDVELGPQK